MVDAARQGLELSHDQAAGLNRAQQMLGGHAQSLEQARNQLAAKWPPDINAASAAYLGELDRLIAAVRETALSCAVNVFHINTVSDAIVQAHNALAPLHDEFVKNEKALALYDAEINAFGNGAAAIPGSSTIARGAARSFTSPPVEDGRQDDLIRQAQEAMVPLAGAARDGATYIKPPARYVPPTVGSPIDENPRELSDGSVSGSSDGAFPPPTIDAPAYTRNQTDTMTPPADGRSTPSSTGGSGPVLSGYSPAPTTPGSTPPIGTTNLITPGSRIDPHLGLLPELGTPTTGNRGRVPGSPSPIKGRIGRGPLGNNGVVRGGVIGNVPVGTGAAATTPSRVNASAGVVGQQPVHRGKGAAGNPTASKHGATTGGAQDRRGGRGSAAVDEAQRDPDNPWEIQEGVDPVIMPVPSPGRVDPGPGIIGIDR